MNILNFLRDWSEVWALIIPLIVLLVYPVRKNNLHWIRWYVFTAFVINFLAIFSVEYFKLVSSFWQWGNGLFYNLHSFVMVVFFSGYFFTVRKYKYEKLLKLIMAVYITFVLVNFLIFESPMMQLSTRHFTVGSIVLLVICLFYFIRSIADESQHNLLRHPSFIIATAVFLYQAITFFIFLFIYPMFDKAYNQDQSFAFLMMRVYQVVFVVFCLLIALALYRSKRLTTSGQTNTS